MATLLLFFLMALVLPSHEIYNVEDDEPSAKPVTKAPSITSTAKPLETFNPGPGTAFFGQVEDIVVGDNSTWANKVFACGNATVKDDDIVELIVGGSPTLEGQWPWHAAIYVTETVNFNYKCGGTLITSQSIITAAHCTTHGGIYPFRLFNLDAFTIHLGKHNLISSRRGVQIRYVETVIVHPEYNPKKRFYHDLSIIRMDEPARFTHLVNPACLWREEIKDVSNIVGKLGTVIGFGAEGTGVLKQVELPVVDELTCTRSRPEFYGRVSFQYTFCAGRTDGKSPCNGDSGGGIFFKVDGFWYVRGLVSIAPAKPGERICDPTQYVVFTDLAQFLPWIRSNVV